MVEDCLLDLKVAGMREREMRLLLKMNERAKMVIETIVGKTKEITEEKIVKQGTVYGPQMCFNSTDKVNTIGERPTTIISPTMKR